ncbi:hypothetical protein BDV12DRAFT_209579 [Aspergillus spectabilis]
MQLLEQVPPGLVHGLEFHSFQLKATVAVFLAIALFNSLELVVLICWTFRQWRGLYFWPLLISSLGMIPYGVGSILHYYTIGPLPLGLAIAYIGFLMIVPLQSFVLYSRLHLVFYNEKFLKVLLDVIIAIAVILVVANTITTWGSARIRAPGWNYAYNVVERLQGRNRMKRIMYKLLAISFAVMALDVAIIVIEYMNLYYLQVCLKVMVYTTWVKVCAHFPRPWNF